MVERVRASLPSDEQLAAARRFHLANWKAGRELGGEPHLEWSYPRHVARTLALSYRPGGVLGQQYFYEPVHDFDDLNRVLYLTYLLREAGAPPEAIPSVGVGFNAFDSIFYLSDGRLTLPVEGERWRGRHYVAVAGWVDAGETLLFPNSWGERWGEQGYGYMSRKYFDAYADCVVVSYFAHIGLTEDSFGVAPDPTNPEWLASWLKPRDRTVKHVEIRGNAHELASYRVVSVDWGCPVDVIEIWAAGRRWAWAHLFHPPGYEGRRSVIREFFVDPSARGRGLGSFLEEACAAQARAEESVRLGLEVDEADRAGEAMARARAFAESCGYSWTTPAPQIRPILVGVAVKDI